MTDQHQCLVILREFANVNIDKAAGTSLKFNIEWREERDSVFQDRGVSHDFNCVSFYNRLEIKRCARECCIKVGSERGAAGFSLLAIPCGLSEVSRGLPREYPD